jgi:integrase
MNLDARSISFERGLQRVPNDRGGSELMFRMLKSDRSHRQVLVPESVAVALKAHRRTQAERRLASGVSWNAWGDEWGGLVCERGDGSPLEPWDMTVAFKRYAAKVGIPAKTRLHDLRHAFATTLLKEDVHPAIASAVLGHSSAGFTMTTYQHLRAGCVRRPRTRWSGRLGEERDGRTHGLGARRRLQPRKGGSPNASGRQPRSI